MEERTREEKNKRGKEEKKEGRRIDRGEERKGSEQGRKREEKEEKGEDRMSKERARKRPSNVCSQRHTLFQESTTSKLLTTPPSNSSRKWYMYHWIGQSTHNPFPLLYLKHK